MKQYSVQQLAEKLGVERKTARKFIEEGLILAVITGSGKGKRYSVPESEVKKAVREFDRSKKWCQFFGRK